MDEEARKRIEDFFEGFELIEFLQISVSDVIEAFEDEIEVYLDEIEELMGVTSGFPARPGEGKESKED